jgi:O-antigen/teichoic acid export membrane protein
MVYFSGLPGISILVNKLDAAYQKNDRSSGILKNIINSSGIRGLSIVISLVLLPLTLNYVNAMQYGIWVTVSSVIAWMSSFDLGMGNGLRNKVAAAYAHKSEEKGRMYVSTTYAVLGLIALFFFFSFMIFNIFLDWSKIFNTPGEMRDSLSLVVVIVLVCFCFQFILQTINQLLTAIHLPYKANLVQFSGHALSLVGILFLTFFTESNLLYMVAVLAASPVIMMAVFSLFYFSNDLRFLKPNFKLINFKMSKGLFTTGGVFFVIQIGALVLYQTDNLIIANVLGMEQVSVFNVVYKYYMSLFMVISVVLTPYWSAFTDAFELNDYAWMRNNIQKLRKIFLGFILLCAIIIGISPIVFKYWIGDALVIPFSVSLAVGSYFIVFFWHNIHTVFINGIGKLRIQLITILLGALVNVPLSILLGNLIGLSGVILSNFIIFTITGIVFYVQVEKILNQNAMGIWNK